MMVGMKIRKVKTISAIVLCFMGVFLANIAEAQQVIDRPQLFKRESPYLRYTSYRVSLTGGLGVATGSLGDFMAANTFRNYSLAVDFVFPKNNMSVGFAIGSQYFVNRLPRQVYEYDNGAISAVQTRTVTAYPITLTGSYHVGDVNARVRPYVQAGLGAAFAEVANYYGMLSTGDNGFKFVAQGGAGVRVLLSKTGNVGLELGATYQHIPFKIESEGLSAASSINARVGLFYRWW